MEPSLATRLYEAALNGHADEVSRLMDAGADGEKRNSDLDYTALHIAARCGHPLVVKVLLEFKDRVDANAVDSLGNTPLHLASDHGHLNVIQVLLRCPRVCKHPRNIAHEAPADLALSSTQKMQSLNCWRQALLHGLDERFHTGFISLWEFDQDEGTGLTLTLPLLSEGKYDFEVSWGDSSFSRVNNLNFEQEATHTYATGQQYVVSITGQIKGFSFGKTMSKSKKPKALRLITHFGPLNLGNAGGYFEGCNNLCIIADDALDLLGTENAAEMFAEATHFRGDLSEWNTESITDMSLMFIRAAAFNQDISLWNTANVQDMNGMFFCAVAFNQDISLWNTANVTNMNGMFHSTAAFNQDISLWNTANVKDMSEMFCSAAAFNQDISLWNTANVQDMSCMFFDAAAFNQDISLWNTENVQNMNQMFCKAAAFKQDISSLHVLSDEEIRSPEVLTLMCDTQ
jgi:surface protein